MDTAIAVSYTHLDVYKRQIVYSKEQIEIQFKYSDEMQEMIEAVQIIRERQERKGEFVCGA